MLASFLVSLVDFSRKRALALVLAFLLASALLGSYVVRTISINTDINQLLSEDLGWRKREKELETAFPHKIDTMVVVIDAEDGVRAENAAAALAGKMQGMTGAFSFVSRPDALPFYRENGLLFLSQDELADALDQMTQAQPMLGAIVSDPSLRGFFGTVGMMVQGVLADAVDPAQIQKPLAEVAATMNAALNGQDRFLNLGKMMPERSDAFAARELRRYIVAKPVLDYSALQPGAAASEAVRKAAAELGLTDASGVRVRLTGSTPLNDEEFASVSEGAELSTALSGVLVLALLFMAMRTWRIVLPIMLTLAMGLVASTAFATFAVGSLNLISVAFAVMFIGIAVDFGIQFGIRYRDEHSRESDHAAALANAARAIAAPLAMAASATTLGFFAFTPTDYRGVSELGLIAGSSMVIAFFFNLTLLPALMSLTRPRPESEGPGIRALTPVNNFLTANGKVLAPLIALLALAGLAGAMQIRFDFDPLNLKNPEAESVSTMFEAMEDPESDAYAAQILAASQAEALALAEKLDRLPEVDHALTLASFVPEDQEEKLELIADTALLLEPTFGLTPLPAASDEENIAALRKAADLLRQAQDKLPAAKGLADILDKTIAQGSPELLARAQNAIVTPVKAKVAEMRGLLGAQKITLDGLPDELRRDWISADGRWLVEALPKRGADNNPRDPDMLNRFIDAVQKVAPEASGTPVSIRESGRTIVSAFVHAGIYGLSAICLLAFFVLGKVRDVFVTVSPLLLAGILTLATMTLFNLSLNFANVIALPLLFSLGLSYSVYFVFLARQGRRDFLQSSTARAVLFSAATTLVAFVSLSFSSHTGTRGMGELLTISLLYSLLCTFVVLPILYGFRNKDRLG